MDHHPIFPSTDGRKRGLPKPRVTSAPPILWDEDSEVAAPISRRARSSPARTLVSPHTLCVSGVVLHPGRVRGADKRHDWIASAIKID